MFIPNFKHELKILLRSKWLLILFVTILITFLYAGYNGKQKTIKRLSNLEKINSIVKQKDTKLLQALDSIEKGLKQGARNPWKNPTQPMTIGQLHPRVAAMPPQPLAFIATGQSDLFTNYIQPKAYGDNFLINYTALANPIQLLFGNFDLAFVIIYLLPLIVIAFSYNIFSAEKEYGSLKLLASQPVSIFTWSLQKISFRFFFLTFITLIALTVVFGVNNFNFSTNFSLYLNTILLVTAYLLFWFAIVFLVNILLNNSAKNAVSLLAVWVIVILIIPALIAQLGNTIYPVPSRTKLISEVRALKEKIAKKQDKILDNYLRDHPEYASKTTTNYSFWHRYMATQDMVETEIRPLIDSYEVQLKNQQQWIKKLQYISPAIVLQQAFNAIAGTSTLHYQNYKAQTSRFSSNWRNFFTPLLYQNKLFSTKLYHKLPVFKYQHPQSFSIAINLVVILTFSLFLLIIGWWLFNKNLKKGTVI